MKEPKNYDLKWIYALSKGVRRYYVILVITGIATAVVNLGLTTILKNLVNIAAGDLSLSLSFNLILSVGFVLLEGAAAITTALTYRLSTETSTKKLRLRLCKKYYESDLLSIEKHHAGEYLTNLTTDVENVSSCIPSMIRQTVGSGLSAIAAIVYLFIINWKMALIMLISVPLLILCIAAFSPVLQKASETDKKNEENTRVFIQELLQKITIFKVGVIGQFVENKLLSLLNKKVESSKKLGLAEGGSEFLNNIMGTTMMLVSIGGGAYFATKGELTVGSLIAVVQLANYIVWPFVGTGAIISQVNQSIASAKRLGVIESLEAEKEFSGDFEEKRIQSLRFDHVSFSYEDKHILENVNAEFIPDCTIGVIGESGSGKSTILKLIAGLYKPAQGSITASYSGNSQYEGSLIPYTAIVPPDNQIFQDTVRTNICMGRTFDSKKFSECIKMANISDFVESLEEKENTVIGDGKRALSSGQEQRIAIARMLYQGSKILLFDEPTANLDSESTEILIQTLRVVKKDHVCLIATHDKKLIDILNIVYEVRERNLVKVSNTLRG